MDTLATMTSIALQYGVPLRDLVNKFTHVRFEPSGFTGNPEVPIAKSIVDYVFRWMGSRFLPKDDRDALGILGGEVVAVAPPDAAPALNVIQPSVDGESESTVAASLPAPSTSSGGEGGARPLDVKAASSSNGSLTASNGRGNGHAGASLGSSPVAFSVSADSPSCMDCGSIMVRNGSCYKCLNCGSTSGCS
jgi:ribonucleoside-diphosphate reductase alpha chain